MYVVKILFGYNKIFFVLYSVYSTLNSYGLGKIVFWIPWIRRRTDYRHGCHSANVCNSFSHPNAIDGDNRTTVETQFTPSIFDTCF